MSFYEFKLKSFAFNRMEKDKWRHTRKIAFWSMWGSNADAKRFPNTENKFMPLDDEPIIKRASDEQKDQLYKEQLQYLLDTKQLDKHAIALKNYEEWQNLKQK